MNTLKNNKGGAISVIIISVALVVFFINCYTLLVNYNLTNEKRFTIKNKIESSYSQSTPLYLNDFDKFCKVRDFINSEYKPKIVYIIYAVQRSDSATLFNIDQIDGSSKVPLSSKPLNSTEVSALISSYISKNDYILNQINQYLKSNPKNCLVYYKYEDSINKKITIESYLEMSN